MSKEKEQGCYKPDDLVTQEQLHNKLEIMALKMGYRYNGNGGRAEKEKITPSEAKEREKIVRIESEIKSLSSRSDMYGKAILGSLLGIFGSFAMGFYWGGSNAKSIEVNTKDVTTLMQENKSRERELDLAYHDWGDTYVNKETFNTFREAINVEIQDRKNYSVRNQEKIEGHIESHD